MFDSFNTLSRRRRSGLINRFWAMLTCVMLLPLPLPIAHEHQSFESADALAIHVQQHHQDSDEALADLSETHWHFSMPSSHRHEHRSHDGYPADQFPSAPGDYTGSLSSVSQSIIVQHPSADAVPAFACVRALSPMHLVKTDQRRSWLVEIANQRYRSAHSCVLRC